ncbi:lysine 5,6-aminomutase subunit alpha TIM-barrel domain-containing protein [Anaeromyxobacter diazotrophicus]|uniref:L-beta-lysine 5,6-aminomutase alpha subunit n=1 Tax=Anaeromyxobacter diazotrophicus TaxID=2590199 RepID=A0A7I9VME4_9BACT|nr:lysine 5,6-aminomutase subunit alpha [Anaeromyxobacter diazotrophicus]GEJ57157.1 L-beta-lysine 5,6-aminomutase alpha subunit [Anaeromyxobacter diazotrophicus]
MRLADGRIVPDLPLDAGKVERCRALADRVTAQVLQLVGRHTTTSIERTVLRMFGFHGAGPRGVPWVNLMVDELHARGLLAQGAAYWLGYVLRAGARDPAEVAARFAALPRSPAPLAPAEEAALRAEVADEARAAARELRRRVEAREALKRELGVGARPHRYVIVATGNIHDDVEQARAAAEAGADVIAVIRSTAQSLLDYVPDGATTEGYGGTYATQENFRIMREALDEESRKLGRYLHLTNYSSGLCMSEIAFAAAWERLDMLLNDAMYGILFRDINMKRTLCDQHFSRRICAFAGIVINTGEDNYITTADADEAAHTVIASQFVNESFAHRAGLPDRLIGLGHSFEIDPAREDTIARELAQALLVRTLFPDAPIKYMPPTKHKQGDIFFSHVYDVMADVVGQVTGQSIQLLGMMTEAMHNPFLLDRYEALKGAAYVYRAWRSMGAEIQLRPDGLVARRADETLSKALALLEEVAEDGLMKAIGQARFGDVARREDGGKGLSGVVERAPGYLNPFLDVLEAP